MKNKIDIGISEKDRKKIADGLSHLLADSYTLYLQTHNFHWNVTGSMFQTLHLMFETHYNELALAVDAIAERIRALGYPAPGTYAEFSKLSSIKRVLIGTMVIVSKPNISRPSPLVPRATTHTKFSIRMP